MREWDNCIDKREYMFYYMYDDPDGIAELIKYPLKRDGCGTGCGNYTPTGGGARF